MPSSDECIAALRTAAERLGESPTKAQYEELGLTPASATIMRVMGGWNAAKEAAELETFERGGAGGPDVEPKPDWVELADDEAWNELSGHQRWYRKNRDRQKGKKRRRRRMLILSAVRPRRISAPRGAEDLHVVTADSIRRWLHEYKRDECSCRRCGEGAPACLDFHHPAEAEKTASVADLVKRGFAKVAILAEIDKCEVLCANCHRKEHYSSPPSTAESE